MKKLSVFLLLIALQSCMIGSGDNSKVEANLDNYFPKVSGIDLAGEEQNLPAVFNKEFNLVVVAFKREQQSEVNSWINALEPILKENQNLSFYEIPVIYELSSFKRMWINNGMRFGIPDEIARKRTITVYTNRDEFFKITEMKEDNIYALLLDNQGKILWRIAGVASGEKIADLMRFLK